MSKINLSISTSHSSYSAVITITEESKLVKKSLSFGVESISYISYQSDEKNHSLVIELIGTENKILFEYADRQGLIDHYETILSQM